MLLAIPVIALTLFATNAPGMALARQADPVWLMLCSGNVRPVPKELKLRRGSAEVKDSIRLCTKHVYEFPGKTGKRLRVRLSAGTQTWMIISENKGDRVLNYAAREWEGFLPRNGKYTLVVVTGETTPYSIDIRLR